MSEAPRICAVVPTFDNPRTVRAVVEAVRAYDLEVVLVDDGSGAAGRAVCEAIAAAGLATVRHLPRNGGKGAAVKAGFAVARDLGYAQVLQVDADGQHDLTQIPAFLAAARSQPDALVLGYPVYDASMPAVRRVARRITDFWVAVEVGGRDRIRDAMIGFRVYPLAAVAELGRLGNRMDFDVEIAVRLVRAGTPTVNLPVRVRYLSAEAGGVSHFQPWRDNLRFCWLHSRLCTAACMRWLGRRVTGRRR